MLPPPARHMYTRTNHPARPTPYLVMWPVSRTHESLSHTLALSDSLPLYTLSLSGLCALVCPAVGDQEGVCACVVGEGESWYTIGLNNPPHTGQPATITRSPGTQGAVDSTSMAETADKRSRCAQCTGGAPTS